MRGNSKGIKLFIVISGILFYLLFLNAFSFAASATGLRLGVPLFAGDAPVTEDFVSHLNEFLKPDDILFVRGTPRAVRLLKLVKNGKVAVVRQSIADLKKDVEFLLSKKVKIDYLCYNPEAWKSSNTPQEEKDDPVKAVENARKLAEEHGLGLIVVPDTAITLLAYGAEMAVYADIFVIQLQRWQLLDEEGFQKLVSRTIWWVKTGNPGVTVFVQLSTNPPAKKAKAGKKVYKAVSAADMLAKVRSIEKLVDGAGFLLRAEDEGFERFYEFLRLFRPVK